jgi:predicted transcriptional regulator
MPDKTIISFRIRADLKEALHTLTTEDRRSLRQYIENALEDHIRAASKRSAEPERSEGKPLKR